MNDFWMMDRPSMGLAVFCLAVTLIIAVPLVIALFEMLIDSPQAEKPVKQSGQGSNAVILTPANQTAQHNADTSPAKRGAG